MISKNCPNSAVSSCDTGSKACRQTLITEQGGRARRGRPLSAPAASEEQLGPRWCVSACSTMRSRPCTTQRSEASAKCCCDPPRRWSSSFCRSCSDTVRPCRSPDLRRAPPPGTARKVAGAPHNSTSPYSLVWRQTAGRSPNCELRISRMAAPRISDKPRAGTAH